MQSILLIDDDQDLCGIIELALEMEYDLQMAHDGASGLKKLNEQQFDAVILDWELPDMSGIEIAEACRAKYNLTPILMLTGRQQIDDKVLGLDSGADDYLTKPFEMRELQARLRKVLRNASGSRKNSELTAGGITLNQTTHKVTVNGKPVELASHEFLVLELLMSNPRRAFSINSLIQKLWNGDGSEDSVRGCMKRLRQKLGPEASQMIETTFGVGYSIQPR